MRSAALKTPLGERGNSLGLMGSLSCFLAHLAFAHVAKARPVLPAFPDVATAVIGVEF